MGRKKKRLKPGEPGHLSVAVTVELLMALDKEAERRTKEDKLGGTVRRSDVVKEALVDWLKAREK